MKAPVTVAQAWAVVSEHYGFCVQAAQPVEWSCPDTGRTCTAEDCDKSCVQQAQPVGPVAWRKWDADVESWDFAQYQNAPMPGWHPLYALPPDTTVELARLREAMKQALDALTIGIDLARDHAADVHEKLAGYKPHTHATVDADVGIIEDAIVALKEASA